MELERRVNAMLEENELMQNTVDDLRERTLVLEKQYHAKDLQVQRREGRTVLSHIFEILRVHYPLQEHFCVYLRKSPVRSLCTRI